MRQKTSRSQRRAMWADSDVRMANSRAEAERKAKEGKKPGPVFWQPPKEIPKVEEIKPPQSDASAVAALIDVGAGIKDSIKDLRKELLQEEMAQLRAISQAITRTSIQDEKKDLFAQTRTIAQVSIYEQMEFILTALISQQGHFSEICDMIDQQLYLNNMMITKIKSIENLFEKLIDKLCPPKKKD